MSRQRKEVNPLAGLSENQQSAVFLAATGATNSEVAEAVGVNRVTVWRWRKLETFEAALDAVQLSFIEDLERGFVARVPKALRTLDDLHDSENANVRFRVAQYCIAEAQKTRFEHADLASKVRIDAARLFPDVDPLASLLEEFDDDLLDRLSPEGRKRVQYLEDRFRELGVRRD